MLDNDRLKRPLAYDILINPILNQAIKYFKANCLENLLETR